MSRKIEIELPDVVTVNGMGDAPDHLRSINTMNWDSEFCLTAIIHGVSQKQGDTWSVSKKDIQKTQKIHDALVSGDWSTKARTSQSALRFDAAIAKLNADQLIAKLPAELLSALAVKINADKP